MEKPASPIILQSSQMPKSGNLWPKIIPTSLPKLVFIILSLIIVGELIWGAWYISSTSSNSKKAALSQAKAKSSAKISLIAKDQNIKVGDNLVVDILISSNGRQTTGADLSLKFDPNLLSLSKESFSKGPIYDEYLGQTIDNNKGSYKISGLSNLSSKNSDGKFGSLTFKVLATGKATISVDFKPGSSIDSNVIDGKQSKDILDKVDNLEVNIK